MKTDKEEPGAEAPRSGVSAPGVGLIDFPALPPGTRVTTLPFAAVDGMGSRGVLYTRGGERGVVCLSHPRADLSQHYAIPFILEAGFAAYAHQCRGLNNDIDCVHEQLILDLAAGFSHLRNERGYEEMILLGTSGGGSLMSFYQSQAVRPAGKRLASAPCGSPTRFADVDMPAADGIILLAAHAGAGVFLMEGLDPSIVDESDPLSIDPTLDMYDPANGFRAPPEASDYAPDFLERYRAAQIERVRRIDARARSLIAMSRSYREQMAAPTFSDLPATKRMEITRQATAGHYLLIYRTEANPAYCDLKLHSWTSTRQVGSLAGTRPDLANYGPGGFARCLTPRAWLSSWSGLSSNAAVAKTIASNEAPLLIISLTRDNGAFPDNNRAELDLCPATDKQQIFINADHYGQPTKTRETIGGAIARWLTERYPVAQPQHMT